MKVLANLVSSPITRVLLGIVGAFLSWIFGPLAIVYLLVGIQDLSGFFLVIGGGGVAGLLGWWLRVLLPTAILARRPWLRRLILALLAAGTVAAAVVTVELGGPFRWIFVPTTLLGVLMVAGSVRGLGPNDSSKPTPLRGAA